MAKKPAAAPPPRIQNIERVIECDTKRLYGPLFMAIAYLHEIQQLEPTATLEEEWSGYEDMELRFVYHNAETDEEYQTRLDYIELARKNRERDTQKAASRQTKLAQFNKLKRELGL